MIDRLKTIISDMLSNEILRFLSEIEMDIINYDFYFHSLCKRTFYEFLVKTLAKMFKV